MDWNDIETAADPGNYAYTANELLGHAVILLNREAPKTPFVSVQDANSYSSPVGRAVRVLNAIWRKHQRRSRDETTDVVKSLEKALAKVDTWFHQGFPGGAEEVMAERAFDEAATLICHAEGHWLPGTYTGRFWREPSHAELDAARSLLQRDTQRLAAFEALTPLAWLRQASVARCKRAPWEHAAEGLIGLRLALEQAIPSGPRTLTRQPVVPI